MADVKISALTNFVTPLETDILPVVDLTAGATKKVTVKNLDNYDPNKQWNSTTKVKTIGQAVTNGATTNQGKIVVLSRDDYSQTIGNPTGLSIPITYTAVGSDWANDSTIPVTISVWAYKDTAYGRVYSATPASATTTPDDVTNTNYYISASWTAVTGATGYYVGVKQDPYIPDFIYVIQAGITREIHDSSLFVDTLTGTVSPLAGTIWTSAADFQGDVDIDNNLTVGGTATVTGSITGASGSFNGGLANIGAFDENDVTARCGIGRNSGTDRIYIANGTYVLQQDISAGIFRIIKAGVNILNIPIATGALDLFDSTNTKVFSILGGKIVEYNNIITVGNGVPSAYGVLDSTTKAAALAATTIYTPTVSGRFLITAYLKVKTAATTSSILGAAPTVTFTDPDDSVAQSQVMNLQDQAGVDTITGNALNTTAAKLTGSVIINAKAGVAIQIAHGYTSVGATAMVHIYHYECIAI